MYWVEKKGWLRLKAKSLGRVRIQPWRGTEMFRNGKKRGEKFSVWQAVNFAVVEQGTIIGSTGQRVVRDAIGQELPKFF